MIDILNNFIDFIKKDLDEKSVEKIKKKAREYLKGKYYIVIKASPAQRKDFLEAMAHIMKQGNINEGRACQLLSADYFSGN
jgi:hypothetical protein